MRVRVHCSHSHARVSTVTMTRRDFTKVARWIREDLESGRARPDDVWVLERFRGVSGSVLITIVRTVWGFGAWTNVDAASWGAPVCGECGRSDRLRVVVS